MRGRRVNLSEMSGLELVQAITDGKLPHPTMADTIPMRISDAGRGHVTFRARADGRHLNPLGGVHGGFAATVLDSVTGCAVHTMLDAGVAYGTIDPNVKMLKAIPPRPGPDRRRARHSPVEESRRGGGVAQGCRGDPSRARDLHLRRSEEARPLTRADAAGVE